MKRAKLLLFPFLFRSCSSCLLGSSHWYCRISDKASRQNDERLANSCLTVAPWPARPMLGLLRTEPNY